MKKIFLIVALAGVGYNAGAQNKAMSAREKMLTDSICNTLSKRDLNKINNKDEAVAAFTNCFASHTDLLLKIADEQHGDANDEAAMEKIGIQIGKDLLAINCEAFTKISVKMVQQQSQAEGTGSSDGVFNVSIRKGSIIL